MKVVASLWAMVQGDATFMRRVNGWLTIFWIFMIPVSLLMGWLSSVVYVSALSLWALVSGHWSAWQAARVEVAQQREAERREQEDLPGDVVERIVQETEVRAASDLASSPPPAAPPGWYEHPQGLRWWSGDGWREERPNGSDRR